MRLRLPWRLFGGDKRDDNANIFAAEKIVKYRAIFMALDVSPRNSSAAVPAVQSDPNPSEVTRISGGDRGDERDGKAKNRRRREKT